MSKNEYICDCNAIHQEVVNDTIKKMPEKDLVASVSNCFKVLGDPTRAKILFALDNNEMCVCDIANVLGMSKSSISHQLSVLRKNGIVTYRKEGKEVYYMLDDEHIKQIFELTIVHIKHKSLSEGGDNKNAL